ncbi:MAG: hypothetical protein AAGB31_11025, partial [Bdellovibrio sp.]
MKKETNIPTYEKVDFGMWERMYGRTLTDDEKKEIGERMSGFARLLIQEDLRQKKEVQQKEIAEVEK